MLLGKALFANLYINIGSLVLARHMSLHFCWINVD